jgi:hypothetical protein
MYPVDQHRQLAGVDEQRLACGADRTGASGVNPGLGGKPRTGRHGGPIADPYFGQERGTGGKVGAERSLLANHPDRVHSSSKKSGLSPR